MGNIITLDDPNVWKVIKDLLIHGWKISTEYDTLNYYTIHATKKGQRWNISVINKDGK